MSQQLIQLSQPAPRAQGCNGNCNQGRCCTCVADIPEADEQARDDRAAATFWRWYGSVATLAILAYVAYLQRGVA